MPAIDLSSPLLAQPLPAIVDEVASREPDRHLITISHSSKSAENAKKVTYGIFARAVDRTAAWLDGVLGKADEFPAYSFMSTNFDVRYFIFALASIKVGHVIFFPSPRNSEEHQLHLINKLGIKTIVSSIGVGLYSEKAGCRVVEPPSLEELLADGPTPSYPYKKNMQEAMKDPICIVHSSGSTGPPKPITWTNGYFDSTRRMFLQDYTDENIYADDWDNGSLMLAMPFFHTAGYLTGFVNMFYLGHSLISFPHSEPLSATSATDFIRAFKPTRAMLPPSILEDISADEELLKTMEILQIVQFGGAGLAEEAGERISGHTTIITAIGSSEASAYPTQMPRGVPTYSWFHFAPIPGFTFREQEDGLYELVYEQNDTYDWPVFHSFPDKYEYPTSDLYYKHPTAPNHWKMYGRKDDVLVLSNGEKVVPIPMESFLRLAPEVTGALYFGNKRFTVGALVELDDGVADTLSQEEIFQRLRQYAMKANEVAPAFARLTKEMVIFTNKEKPMRRAAKGSVLRKSTIADYSPEIEDLYKKAETVAAVPLVNKLTEDETQRALFDIFHDLINKKFSIDDDLFQSVGADSLQVISATRTIKASVQAEAPQYAKKVTSGLVYANPTIRQLSATLRSLIHDGDAAAGTRDVSGSIEAMLDKYLEGIPQAVPHVSNGQKGYNVMLTGSTGSLGSYMISLLIENPLVSKIYALNRSENSRSRQQESNTARGLSADMSKVTFLEASLGNKSLGLGRKEYQELVDSTDLIIHNAWPVNFNQSLDSFEPHIRGVRNLIDLAALSPIHPHIVFISSIATLSGWDAFYPGQPRPEEITNDSRPTLGQGYGASKWVGEQLLAKAASHGINSTIARVGQVCGPVESLKGQWNKQEWVPSIAFSSKHIGKLPATLGNAATNWIPVDWMAKIVIELGMGDLADDNLDAKSSRTTAYNLVNPTVTSWEQLVPAMTRRLPHLAVVPWQDWVAEVRAAAEDSTTDIQAHPAVKLIEFYESIPAEDYRDSAGFSTEKARTHSQTMAAVPPVNAGWMDIWMNQWAF